MLMFKNAQITCKLEQADVSNQQARFFFSVLEKSRLGLTSEMWWPIYSIQREITPKTINEKKAA